MGSRSKQEAHGSLTTLAGGTKGVVGHKGGAFGSGPKHVALSRGQYVRIVAPRHDARIDARLRARIEAYENEKAKQKKAQVRVDSTPFVKKENVFKSAFSMFQRRAG